MATGVYLHNKGYKRPPFSKEWREKLSLAKLGKKQSPEVIEKRRLKLIGHKAWNKGVEEGKGNAWKGNYVGYGGLHEWVRKHLGKATKCENGCISKKYEWANISGEYKRDLNDFKQLCTSCHHIYDDVYVKAWETRRIYA